MVLAVASGKGGTGKTTIAVNLALSAGGRACLLDCDVEEPNAGLFLGGSLLESSPVTLPVPAIDPTLCDACGECSRFCSYSAIVSLVSGPLVFPDLCHGCGGCALVCPRKAIHERGHRIGVVERIRRDRVTLVQGRLDVGRPMAPPVVRAVRAKAPSHALTIIDAPPGTGCPAVAAVRGADFVLLVTEPTPFGLNDLKLAVEMVRLLGIPLGVLVNRAGAGDRRVYNFCRQERIEVLLELPDDRRIAEAYSRGELIVDTLPEYRPAFEMLLKRIRRLVPGSHSRARRARRSAASSSRAIMSVKR